MSYLIGGGAITTVIAVATLGVLMYRLARGGRSDLHKLVQSTKDLSDVRRDNDGYKRSVEEIEHALEERTAELERERAAMVAAREALNRAHQRLAASGDATGVAADIRRLSEMSPVSLTPITKNDNG